MTRLLLIFASFALCLGLAAKGAPDISFDKMAYDFGTIRESYGLLTCTFTYTNTGDSPLVLNSVSAPCDCTKPSFSPKPLAPGKSAEITVNFTPKDMSGEFMRSITVWTNVKDTKGNKKKYTLRISGVVIPK